MPPGCGARSGGPVRASARQRSGACGAGAGPAWSRATGTVWPAAGTPAGAGAAHWLQAQGAAVKRVRGLVIGEEAEDAERLSAFLAGLPALVSADGLVLHADLHRRPSAEAIRAFLAGAVRAVGCCASLRTLHLRVVLLRGLAGQVPTALARELAGARALEEVTLTFKAIKAKRRKWPVIPSLAHLVAGLAGLPRLRALGLLVANVGMEATLPADVSRLTALTRLCLSGLRGLCCEPGWARMPELEFLRFGYCEFACDGEAALPGVDALGALTILELYLCSGLHVLPASLWRLTELPYLAHWRGHDDPPAGGLPASAPCYASLLNLCLSEHQLRDWPAGILTMTSLTDLNLHGNCFEQLPEGVSVLTALQVLCLGRHSTGQDEIGGALDVRALGSLAGFPHLRSLSFKRCSVLFCSDFQVAADHPRLEELELFTSFPVPGPSCGAFLGFIVALLQQGRPHVLKLEDSVVKDVGQCDSRDFRTALRAVGYPLGEADALDLA